MKKVSINQLCFGFFKKVLEPEVVKVDASTAPFDVGKFMDNTLNAIEWLKAIIGAEIHMVYLHGKNPNICQVRVHEEWENSVKPWVDKAWVNRGEADDLLKESGYSYHGNYGIAGNDKEFAKVFIRDGSPKEIT